MMTHWLAAYAIVLHAPGGFFALSWTLEGRRMPHWTKVAGFIALWPLALCYGLGAGAVHGIYAGLRGSYSPSLDNEE